MKSQTGRSVFTALKTGIAFLIGALAVNHNFGALTGAVTANLSNGSDDDLANDVVATPRLTVPDLVKTILLSPKATAAKAVIVDIDAASLGEGNSAIVNVFPTGSGSIGGATVVAALTKDDATKKGSAPMSNGTSDIDNEDDPEAGALQDFINDYIATRKPSISLTSLLGALETYLAGLPSEDQTALGLVHVQTDQADGSISISYGGTTSGTGRHAYFSHDTTPPAEETTFHWDT